MTVRRYRRAVTAVAVALVLLTGCTGVGDDVEVKTEDEVKALVKQRGEQVAALIGTGPLEVEALSPGPCTGRLGETNREIFAVQGSFKVPMEPSKQLETLARIKESWKADGYTITEDRQVSHERGILAAVTKPDEYSISLTTPPSATSLGFLVYSPCFKSPTPR